MQVPILSGIYADPSPDYRTAYPLNLEPIPKVTGVSEGYLRSAEGVKTFAGGPGIDRGGVEWRGVCYRVMGDLFVSVSESGEVTPIGPVGGTGAVALSYGFDYLAVVSGGRLYLYDGTSLQQVTDTDLGLPIDVEWVGGYFFMTDGESLFVTDLGDPFSVNPLSYGSSEVSPDPVVAVVRLNNEVYAVNRHTIEAFANVGGTGFPFQVIQGTQVYRGAVGTHAVCTYSGAIYFVGSGENEEIGVYAMGGGNVAKVSTREIDLILRQYTESQLSGVVCEARHFGGREVLYVHLPDETVCFDGAGSQATGNAVWFRLSSGRAGPSTYRARHFVRCYDKWIVGDPLAPRLGVMTSEEASHYGENVSWEFITPVIYNEGRGVVQHSVELSGLTGAAASGDGVILESHSEDGVTWSAPKPRSVGKRGDRLAPLVWSRLGMFRNTRVHRFTGDSASIVSVARMDTNLEPLQW